MSDHLDVFYVRRKEMKIAKYIGAFLVAVSLTSPGLVFGGEKKEDVHRLDSVIVSATRSEISVFDAPQAVTVITSEEIAASPFERVEDIVRSVPGMYNFRHYGIQTNGIVSPLIMRGVGKNRVLLLVDGVPQNDNFNNAIAWIGWGYIPKDTIERIEIVRGPTSALYGSEGLGGVIHIITKKAAAQRKTSIKGEAGSANTYGGALFHSQKVNDFGFMAAGGYEESDGFYMTDNVQSYNTKKYRRAGKALGKVSYDMEENSDITLSGLYYDLDGGQGREFFHTDLQLDQYWLNYARKGETMGLKGMVYLSRADKIAYQDNANNNYASPYRDEKPQGLTWGADFQGSYSPWKWANMTLGAAFKEVTWDYNEDFPGTTRDAGAEGVQRFISPFLNVDVRLFDEGLILTAGARYDFITTSDGSIWDTKPEGGVPPYRRDYGTNHEESFSPKVGIAYHPDRKTTLRGSAGKGFRAPSLFELYKVHIRGGGTYYRAANPDLKPEEIWSYDLGVERFILSSLLGKLTFYQSFANDYIADRVTKTYVKNNRTYREYILDNVNEAEIYGVEAELHWYARKELALFANYTYNISKITKDDYNKKMEDQKLTDDPKHKIHVGATYQNPDIINLTLLFNYYADWYYNVDDVTQAKDTYWTADLSASRRIYDGLSAYVSIENIFDSVDNENLSPGTIFLGGLKFEF
jgi:iron complex outermembrane receptor protein